MCHVTEFTIQDIYRSTWSDLEWLRPGRALTHQFRRTGAHESDDETEDRRNEDDDETDDEG